MNNHNIIQRTHS